MHSLFPVTDAYHCVWNVPEICLYLFSHPKRHETVKVKHWLLCYKNSPKIHRIGYFFLFFRDGLIWSVWIGNPHKICTLNYMMLNKIGFDIQYCGWDGKGSDFPANAWKLLIEQQLVFCLFQRVNGFYVYKLIHHMQLSSSTYKINLSQFIYSIFIYSTLLKYKHTLFTHQQTAVVWDALTHVLQIIMGCDNPYCKRNFTQCSLAFKKTHHVITHSLKMAFLIKVMPF